MSDEKRRKLFEVYSENLLMLRKHGLIPEIKHSLNFQFLNEFFAY